MENRKGRFAPTPSGRMHLGNALCALLAWLSARSAHSAFVLRVEDLDTLRSGGAFTPLLLEDLRWMGLDWDEGPPPAGGPAAPYEQGKRGEIYEEYFERLRRRAEVYPCFCSRAQLHASRAPHQSDGAYVYAGRCRSLPREEAARRVTAGERAAARVRVPPGTEEVFTDGLMGPCKVDLERAFGDFIVRRSDGVFAYQFAVTVDDALMGVREVVRARDLLPSAGCQRYLYRALGFDPPGFTHIPMLLGEEGARLSKRDGSLDFGALRERLTPQELVGRLAALCGLIDRPEPMAAGELVALFDWGKVPRKDILLPSGWF